MELLLAVQGLENRITFETKISKILLVNSSSQEGCQTEVPHQSPIIFSLREEGIVGIKFLVSHFLLGNLIRREK